MAGTRTEKASRAARERDDVAVLIAVLSYDDLLAPEPAVVPLAPVSRITLGRVEAGASLQAVTRVDVGVRDGFASTRHAVVRRGDTDVLSDLDSTNGTWVNGQRVGDHPLADGDLVEIGHALLCYRKVPADEIATLGLRAFGPTRTLSPRLVRLATDLGRIAVSREPVLLLAESGAGKEVAARMIHELSGRRGELVALDGGALPETLFEATLLGHARGAFTGATEAQKGAVVRAHEGTLFLDEVANLSLAAQAKLLRVWEDGAVVPVGTTMRRPVDVRWIAATNGVLAAPGFRDDLRQRMAGFVARIPPLRARREDLGLLAAHLLREAGASRASIEPAAARAFFSRVFAGNVRELRQALRTAVLLAGGAPFELGQLGEASALPTSDAAPAATTAGRVDGGTQRSLLVRTLTATGGNVVQTAAALSTHPRQVYRLLAKHGLKIEDFRVVDASSGDRGARSST